MNQTSNRIHPLVAGAAASVRCSNALEGSAGRGEAWLAWLRLQACFPARTAARLIACVQLTNRQRQLWQAQRLPSQRRQCSRPHCPRHRHSSTRWFLYKRHSNKLPLL